MLGHNVFKARKEDGRDVEFAAIELCQYVLGDTLCVRVADPLYSRQIYVLHKVLTKIALDHVTAFFADSQDFHRLALGQQILRMCPRKFCDVAVKAAAQATFSCHHHQ